MGCPHWRIDFVYERLEGAAMRCDLGHAAYERAAIQVDSDSYKDDNDSKHLESDVEHELCHIAHSPFELVRKMLYAALPERETPVYNGFAELFSQCCEMTVRNMERMVFGLREAANEKK